MPNTVWYINYESYWCQDWRIHPSWHCYMLMEFHVWWTHRSRRWSTLLELQVSPISYILFFLKEWLMLWHGDRTVRHPTLRSVAFGWNYSFEWSCWCWCKWANTHAHESTRNWFVQWLQLIYMYRRIDFNVLRMEFHVSMWNCNPLYIQFR